MPLAPNKTKALLHGIAPEIEKVLVYEHSPVDTEVDLRLNQAFNSLGATLRSERGLDFYHPTEGLLRIVTKEGEPLTASQEQELLLHRRKGLPCTSSDFRIVRAKPVS